jgi:hypothetical protein
MDHELTQKLAPRKHTRLRNPGDFNAEAVWAEQLEWQTNDYDFGRLLRSLLDRLDVSYREEFGVRVDQLADHEEMLAAARLAALWYKQAVERYRSVGIYSYMHSDLDCLLRKKALRLLDRRREAVETCNHETIPG